MYSSRGLQVVFLVCATLIGPKAAHAGWQGLDWGMSQNEVRRLKPEAMANNDRSKDPAAPGQRAELVVSYRPGGLDLQAYLIFGEDGLSIVRLDGEQESECNELDGELVQVYGPPDDDGSGQFGISRDWIDRSNGNIVKFMSLGKGATFHSCLVSYRPLPAPGEEGGL